jgi:hypothetical protein
MWKSVKRIVSVLNELLLWLLFVAVATSVLVWGFTSLGKTTITMLSSESVTITATVIGIAEASGGRFSIIAEGEYNGETRVFQSHLLNVDPTLGVPETVEVLLFMAGGSYVVDVGGRR